MVVEEEEEVVEVLDTDPCMGLEVDLVMVV